MDCSPPGSSVHRDSPGKNAGVGCHALLQGIFSTQGSNTVLPHCGQILKHLNHQGSPRILEWAAYPFSSRTSWPRNPTRVSCIAGDFFTSCTTQEASNLSSVFSAESHWSKLSIHNNFSQTQQPDQVTAPLLRGSREEGENTESPENQADSFLHGVRYGCPSHPQPVASLVILVHGVLMIYWQK